MNNDTCKIPSRSDLTERDLRIIDKNFSPALIAQFKSKITGGSTKRKRGDNDDGRDWNKYTPNEINSAYALSMLVVILGTGLTGGAALYAMSKIFGGSTMDVLYNSYNVLQVQVAGCGDVRTGIARYVASKFTSSVSSCSELWAQYEKVAWNIKTALGTSSAITGISITSMLSKYNKLTYYILEKYFSGCVVNKSDDKSDDKLDDEMDNKSDDKIDDTSDDKLDDEMDDFDRFDFKKMKGKGSKRSKSVKKLKRSKKTVRTKRSKSVRSKRSKSVRNKSRK